MLSRRRGVYKDPEAWYVWEMMHLSMSLEGREHQVGIEGDEVKSHSQQMMCVNPQEKRDGHKPPLE